MPLRADWTYLQRRHRSRGPIRKHRKKSMDTHLLARAHRISFRCIIRAKARISAWKRMRPLKRTNWRPLGRQKLSKPSLKAATHPKGKQLYRKIRSKLPDKRAVASSRNSKRRIHSSRENLSLRALTQGCLLSLRWAPATTWRHRWWPCTIRTWKSRLWMMTSTTKAKRKRQTIQRRCQSSTSLPPSEQQRIVASHRAFPQPRLSEQIVSEILTNQQRQRKAPLDCEVKKLHLARLIKQSRSQRCC